MAGGSADEPDTRPDGANRCGTEDDTMRTLGLAALALTLVGGACLGQELPEPQQLRAAQDDIGYAELLNAAGFTTEQLGGLQDIQTRFEAEGLVPPDVAAVLTKVLAAVLSGMSMQQAHASLGEQQQVLQQAQQRWGQSLQQGTDELQKLLTEEQKDALVWFSSPAHALDNVVEMASGARGIPEAQWGPRRGQFGMAVSQMLSQMSPGGGVTPQQIETLLDQVRALDDATFEAQRATLAQTWLPTLMPNVAQMLQDPPFRQRQLQQVCQRLIAYERGAQLVAAKAEATAAD
jgi:hypothetical protein